jgi:hypothetical protein
MCDFNPFAIADGSLEIFSAQGSDPLLASHIDLALDQQLLGNHLGMQPETDWTASLELTPWPDLAFMT